VRRYLFVPALCLLLLATAAYGQENETSAPPRFTYSAYLQDALSATEQFEASHDLLAWGRLPLRPPRGTLGLMFRYNHHRVDSRYDQDGEMQDVIETMHFLDPLNPGSRLFKLEPDYHGRLQQMEFRSAFGITEDVGVYVTLPLQRAELWLDMTFVPGTISNIGVRNREDLYQMLELLGRPRPRKYYRSKTWEMGDIHGGVYWNFHQSESLSMTTLVRGTLPTGRLAEPSESLIYGLGPQIDVGQGSYGLGFSQRVNLYPLKQYRWIGLMLEASYDYLTEGKRRRPKWLTPDPDVLREAQLLDMDLSYLPIERSEEDYYYVTPGSQAEAHAGLFFSFAYLSTGIGYHFSWQQEADLNEADDLEEMFDTFDAYSASQRHQLGLLIAVPMRWAYLPGVINLSYWHDIAGRSTLVQEDNLSAQLNLFLPF